MIVVADSVASAMNALHDNKGKEAGLTAGLLQSMSFHEGFHNDFSG